MAKRPVRSNTIGPFSKGLNTFSDPSAVPDDGLSELLNMELDLDGSLVSRPPFHDTGIRMAQAAGGNMTLLGLYYTPVGGEYLIASDGVSKTYYLSGGSWTLLTDTFAATAMHQFDDKAWLLAGVGSTNPGGYWSPSGGFVAEPNMPKGTVITSFKYRLWVAQGEQAIANGSRLYFSKLLGVTPFWPASPEFLDVARGDGQNIISVRTYYSSLLIFRTSSIYRFQYGNDPAAGVVEVSVPNIGLDSRWALAEHENYFYFLYEGRAYEFMNGRSIVISQAVDFDSNVATSGYTSPLAVSIFNSRVLFSYYDTVYVFSLLTRTWSRWRSAEHGPLGRVFERRLTADSKAQAYVGTSKAAPLYPAAVNTFINPDFETPAPKPEGGVLSSDWSVTGRRSLHFGDYEGTPGPDSLLATLAADESLSIFARYSHQYLVVDGVRHMPGDRNVVTVRGPAEVYVSSNSWWDVLTIVKDIAYAGGPFSGSMAGYRWTGTPNASTSETYRSSPLLRITDDITEDRELFQCVVRTKIYSFDTPQSYKKLFWWGLDGIFRQAVTAKVTPIVYGRRTTWGELLQKGTTWGSLLRSTWGSPDTQPLSEETLRPDAGSRSQRKFVKFNKLLRFRQVQFELSFETAGDIETAPTRLFSIHAEIQQAQTVSKAIS